MKVLVVGASRGLGLALVKEYANRQDTTVIAGIRGQPGSDLLELGNKIQILSSFDISSEESVHAAAVAYSRDDEELDILIVNAAMGAPAKISQTSSELLKEYLDTNVMGTHRVIRAFLPALAKSKSQTKKIIVLSSQSGSLQRQHELRWGAGGPYGVSKAACNMLAVQFHNDLNYFDGSEYRANRPFVVVPIHPGWVATDMGKQIGDGGADPLLVATQLANLIEKLGLEDSGKFFGVDGDLLPW